MDINVDSITLLAKGHLYGKQNSNDTKAALKLRLEDAVEMLTEMDAHVHWYSKENMVTFVAKNVEKYGNQLIHG